MAHADDVAGVRISGNIHPGKSSSTAQQRRLELEKEVAQLQKLLVDEEKVHEILERALIPRNPRFSLQIPSFLPKRTKEILAELVMVEEEISRLEGEMSKVQQGLSNERESREREMAKFSEYKKPHAAAAEQPKDASTSALDDSKPGKTWQEKVAVVTKPMFFINQAMKQDYLVDGFDKASVVSFKKASNYKPENQKAREIKERASKSAEKESSALSTSKNIIAKSSEAAAEEDLIKILKESSSALSLSDQNGGKYQPNKLSEKIMKCLLCIFTRLMRSSRTVDAEKSWSGNLRPRSRRVDGVMNSRGNIHGQRESGQQDPYGVFEFEDSLLRDVGPYKNLVKFTSNSFDRKIISNSLPLLKKLRVLMSGLQKMELKFLSHQEMLAFWINIYNICIMNGFLELGMPTNPEKVQALRTQAMINVGGNKLSALSIENFVLRQSSKLSEDKWKDDEEATVRTLGLQQPEPNVAFALCSGCKSSPAVRTYTAEGVSSELEKAKLDYLQASIVVTAKRVMVPHLLLSRMLDFATTDLTSLVEWTLNQLPTSWPLRKSMFERLKGQRHHKASDVVGVIPEDLEFQFLLPV